MSVSPKFSAASKAFHATLKQRVSFYFETSGQPPTGTARLHRKALFLAISFVAGYLLLLLATPGLAWAALGCVGMGLITAAIGFNVMHDGAHGSFSQRSGLNRAAALTLDFFGGSSFFWNVKHNIIHHAYTNIDGVDDDIDIRPWMRLSPNQSHHRWHRFQHRYFAVLYAQLWLGWVFFLDFQKYFSRCIGDTPVKRIPAVEHALFWGGKLSYILVFLVLPVWLVGVVPALVGFLLYNWTVGFVLSLVFQLAHTVEVASFPMPDESNRMGSEWAIHQLLTTANFATRSRLVGALVGGLNFQIEHHLFPKISHVHYPELSKIVRQTCREFGLPYNEYPTLFQAIRSHVRFLRETGRNTPALG